MRFESYGFHDLFSKNKLSIDAPRTQIYSDYAETKKLKCYKKGYSTGEMSGTAPWWLADMSSFGGAFFVENTGKINTSTYLWHDFGVRPVIEVDLSMLDETDVQITSIRIER